MSIKRRVQDILKRLIKDNEELYTGYSEEDKEILREHIKANILFNDGLEKHQKELWRFESIADRAVDEAEYEMREKFKKPWSVKGKIWLDKKIFRYREDNLLFCSKINMMKNNKGINSNSLVLAEIKTEMGFIYYLASCKGKVIFTAHFFDRYIERLKLNVSRNEALFMFLENRMRSSEQGIMAVSKDNDCTASFKEGIGLGRSYLDTLTIIKTFITKEQANKHQKERLEDLVGFYKEEINKN